MVDHPAAVFVDHGVITSWKKHSTTWSGTSIGSITSPGSITALGAGSNSRIGASGCQDHPARAVSFLDARNAPASTRAIATIEIAKISSSRNTAPRTIATTGTR